MIKKPFKIISIVLASAVVFVFAAVLLLTSSPGEDFIKGWLENQLTAQIGLPVSIGKFETNLWSRVQIDTLIVNPSPDLEKPPFLYIGQIHAGYSIPQLLGETVTLKSLAIDSVSIGIDLDSLGRYGIPLLDNPATAGEDSAKESGGFSIGTLSLSRLGLSYLDSQLPLSIELSGAIMSARGAGAGSFSGRLNVAGMLIGYDSLSVMVRNFEVDASLDKEILRIDHARADFEGIHLEARGDLGMVEPKNIAMTVSIDGSLDTLASSLVSAFELPSIKAGRMQAQCFIEGTLDNPNIKLNTTLNDLVLQEVAVPSITLAVQYHNSLLQIDTLQVLTLGGAVNGGGIMMPDSIGASSLSLVLDKINISSLWRAIYAESSPYNGLLNGRIDTEGQTGDLMSWTVEANLTGAKLRYLDRPVPDLDCRVTSQSGKLHFMLVHGTDEIEANIEFASDSLRGDFEISVPDLTALARFLDQPDLSGSLSAIGSFDGAYSNPSFTATVNGSGIVYRNFPVDSIFARLSYKDSSLTLIDFAGAGRLDSINSQHPPFGIDSLAGAMAYECRAQGPLDSLSGSFLAYVGKPRYGSYGLDTLSMEASLNGSQFAIDRLVMIYRELNVLLNAEYDTSNASGSFSLHLLPRSVPSDSGNDMFHDIIKVRDSYGTVSGEFAIKPGSELSATAQGRDLWAGLGMILTDDTTMSDGEIDFDLTLDGPFLSPAADFRATARAVHVADYRIDSLSAQLRLAHNAVVLDSLISYALGHTLLASGRLALGIAPDGAYEVRDDAAVAFELSTREFDLSVLRELFLPEGEISGVASTALNIGGTISAPRVFGWLKIGHGRVLIDEESLPVENIELSLSFADSVLTLDGAQGTVSDMAIEATGSLATSDFETASVNLGINVGKLGRLAVDGTVADTIVHLQVFSDSLDMAVFQPFMTTIDSLSGRMGCRMMIDGDMALPQVEGTLWISSLSFLDPKHYIRLSEGAAGIRFDRNRVILDTASALLNGGKLALSGIIEHTQGELTKLGLTLHANKINLQEPGIYTVAIDSAVLNYGKVQENYILEGDIVLGEARFTAGLRPTSILPWVQSIETVDLELPELIARSRLDVRIRESNNLWVDNNLARIRLSAEIGIIGTPLRPNFTGRVKIEEGYLLYLDRRFRVNEGTVFFNDPVRFNPDIILNASTEVTVYRRTVAQPYTVSIKAEGLLDQLQYGLTSEPPLDKSDIVALLTLGATRTELAGSESDGTSNLTGVLTDRAAMLASATVSGFVSRRAGSLFGFDQFTIQGNLFQFDQTWGPQLVASKRLSRKVDFTYATTVGHLNDQTVRLGYRLTPRFSLQGETDSQGRSGLDLKCGFTFK